MSNLPAHLTNTLPSFLAKEDANLGNESVTANDLVLPRLKVLQQLSPELDEGKSQYIEGAKAGRIVNSVTHEVLESVNVINLHFDRSFNVWLKREMGGGLVGTFPSQEAATNHLLDAGLNVASHDIVETATHYVLTLNDKGEITGQAVIDLISSGLTVSNNWNTNLKMLNAPRFASVWKLSTEKRSNTKGSWYVLKPEMAGYITEKSTYDKVKEQATAFRADIAA